MKRIFVYIFRVLIPSQKLRNMIHNFFAFSTNKKLLHDIKTVRKQLYKSHHDRLFEKLLEGKSVAVVGNGPQQINKDTGKEIDSHDIVIRFNNYRIDGYEKDYGNRTDIWVRNCNIYETKNRQNPEQFKMIVWRFIKSHWENHRELWLVAAAQSLVGKVVYGTIPEDVIIDVSEWLNPNGNTNPTLGAIVIKFLVDYTKAKYVNVYGFSFLDAEDDEKTGTHYYDDYIDFANHNSALEAKLLKEMLIEGRRIK